MSVPAETRAAFRSSWLPNAGAIVADVRPLTSADYDRAVETVCEGLEGARGVRCVATIGGVSLPGVSDIDMLVVCDDEAYASVKSACEKIVSREDLRYFFTHRIFVLPGSLAAYRHRLFLETLLVPPHVVMGESSALPELPPLSAECRIYNFKVWGSTVWSAMFGLRKVRSLRTLLLQLHSVWRQTAFTSQLLSDESGAALSIERAREWRSRVLASERPQHMALEALLEGLGALEDAENAAQCRLGDAHDEGLFLSATDGPCAQRPEGEDVIVLPGFYRRLCAMSSGSFPWLAMPSVSFPDDIEREIAREMIPAQEAALEWGARHAGDPYVLYLGRGGLFPSPFNDLRGASAAPIGVLRNRS
jgi:hypothetical protein